MTPHVFLLLVFSGLGEARELVSGDVYFTDIKKCNDTARLVTNRYGYLTPSDFVVAYCVPVKL